MLSKKIGSTEDLPQSILQQLKTLKLKPLENQILDVLKSYGGTANIDEILVGLYRHYKIVQNRMFLANKLYRMVKRELVQNSKNRGVFHLNERRGDEP